MDESYFISTESGTVSAMIGASSFSPKFRPLLFASDELISTSAFA